VGADQQVSRALDPFHRFNGVDDQVEDHLLHLDPISLNWRQAPRELRLHRDVGAQRFASGQGDDPQDGFVHVQPTLTRWHLLDEVTDPADHLAGPLSVVDDTVEGLADLIQIGRFSS
jgi:hypothetical protein